MTNRVHCLMCMHRSKLDTPRGPDKDHVEGTGQGWGRGQGEVIWRRGQKESRTETEGIVRRWWHMLLIPALGRQRQVNLWVQGQPSLPSEFQDSQGYTEKPCLKQKQKQKTKNKKQKNKKTKTKTQTNKQTNKNKKEKKEVRLGLKPELLAQAWSA